MCCTRWLGPRAALVEYVARRKSTLQDLLAFPVLTSVMGRRGVGLQGELAQRKLSSPNNSPARFLTPWHSQHSSRAFSRFEF